MLLLFARRLHSICFGSPLIALPSELIKMSIDSLVISRFTYALSVWGPMLYKFQLNCLQHLNNWGCVSLPLYRNMTMCMSYHRYQLNWLSLPSLIKYYSLCIMHKIYYGTNVPLNPPITFGSSHAYRTR